MSSRWPSSNIVYEAEVLTASSQKRRKIEKGYVFECMPNAEKSQAKMAFVELKINYNDDADKDNDKFKKVMETSRTDMEKG